MDYLIIALAVFWIGAILYGLRVIYIVLTKEEPRP
jgi:hypothetical protein